MENNKNSRYLNFMKCLFNKADLKFRKLTLHLNSNTQISTMDDTSVDYLNEFNDLNLDDFNNEIENILKYKCIDELRGLTGLTRLKKKTCCSRKFIESLKKNVSYCWKRNRENKNENTKENVKKNENSMK